jgi:hypothetical protein
MITKPSVLDSISRRTVRNYLVIILFASLTTISIQEQILREVEADLGNHMIIEHLLFFSLGILSVMTAEILTRFLISSNNNGGRNRIQETSNKLKPKLIYYWNRVLRKIFLLNNYKLIWPIIVIALIAIWHVPTIFDFATLHESVHILQHISFVVIGACGLIAIRSLGESFMFFVLFSLIGMMGLGGLEFTLTENKIYSTYSISSHNNAGNYMLISSIILLLVGLPVYLIHRTLLHIRAKY